MEEEIILTTEPCCDITASAPVTPVKCPTCCNNQTEEISTDEYIHTQFAKLASVLQESILHAWKLHLKARKYSVHVILEEYYDEAFDIIDGLIEHYQGICKCDIIDTTFTTDINKSYDPIVYFMDLKECLSSFANNSNNFNEKTFEIKSDIDDLLRLIDSTLYKLNNLSESKIKSFDAFVYENYS